MDSEIVVTTHVKITQIASDISTFTHVFSSVGMGHSGIRLSDGLLTIPLIISLYKYLLTSKRQTLAK